MFPLPVSLLCPLLISECSFYCPLFSVPFHGLCSVFHVTLVLSVPCFGLIDMFPGHSATHCFLFCSKCYVPWPLCNFLFSVPVSVLCSLLTLLFPVPFPGLCCVFLGHSATLFSLFPVSVLCSLIPLILSVPCSNLGAVFPGHSATHCSLICTHSSMFINPEQCSVPFSNPCSMFPDQFATLFSLSRSLLCVPWSFCYALFPVPISLQCSLVALSRSWFRVHLPCAVLGYFSRSLFHVP